MSGTVVTPGRGDFVELGRTQTGHLFRKHILSTGVLRHPVTKQDIVIDDTFVNTLRQNFANGVCDIVQVPLANDRNEHVENPDSNIGEVIGIDYDGTKVYALMDIRDDKGVDKIRKKLYLGASAMMSLDYEDTKSGKRVGPTLLHAAVTNRPYITDLEGFEEVLAASHAGESAALFLPADAVGGSADTSKENVRAARETPSMDLAEILSELKDKHGIDVAALQAAATKPDPSAKFDVAKLAATLSRSGFLRLSNGDGNVDGDDLVSATVELAQKFTAVTSRVVELERDRAEQRVSKLIEEGRILPAQRDIMVKLSMDQPDVFEQLVPVVPIVKFNSEAGTAEPLHASRPQVPELDIQAEVDRYMTSPAALAAGFGRK